MSQTFRQAQARLRGDAGRPLVYVPAVAPFAKAARGARGCGASSPAFALLTDRARSRSTGRRYDRSMGAVKAPAAAVEAALAAIGP